MKDISRIYGIVPFIHMLCAIKNIRNSIEEIMQHHKMEIKYG